MLLQKGSQSRSVMVSLMCLCIMREYMEDFEKTPPPPRKRKSRAKNLAGEAAIAPDSDTSSASTEGRTEADGVKVEQVEKRVGEPKVRRSRKPKNVEQRAEASEQTPGGDLDTVQTLPVTSQPTVEEPPQEAPMTSQTETLPTVTPTDMQPDPEVVASKALNSKEKDKEDVSIRVRILQRLLKGSSWMVNVCAA